VVRQYGPPLARGGKPPGTVAMAALTATTSWYVIGALATIFLPFVAIVYIVVALVQLQGVDPGFPGLNRARTVLYVYGGGCLFFLLPLIGSLVS
jgi:hypothetical protein